MSAREWYDYAYRCGKSYQSNETGFIHYHPHTKSDPKSIPIYENLLFVLALIRTKTLEHVQEAKALLKKILNFQVENFPVYLHEYPICFDRMQPYKVLPPLFLIHKEFQKILGEDLEKELSRSIQKLKPLVVEDTYASIFSLDHFSKKLAFLGMNEEFQKEVQAFRTVWHDLLGGYVGPIIDTRFFKDRIQPSYADYFMQYITQLQPPKELSIWGLQAALLPQEKIEMPPKAYPYEMKQDSLYWYHDKNFGFSINQSGKGYPLYVCVGSHSFLLDLPHAKLIRYDWNKKRLQLEIEVDTQSSMNKEKEAVLSLYCSRKDNSSILVEGKRATAFRLGEKLSLQVPNHTLSLSFTQSKGDAHFFGHIVQSNRPAQMNDDQFYDHEVCLRTVQGGGNSTLICDLEFS